MKNEPTECPQCESMQLFPRRIRKLPGKTWCEVFIACTVCPYEDVIKITDDAVERAAGLLRLWEAKMDRDRRRHASVLTSTIVGFDRARSAYNQALVDLARRASGGTDTPAA